MLWSHPSTWMWKPAISLNTDTMIHKELLAKHLSDISLSYMPYNASLTILNLIDKAAVQRQLGETLIRTIQSLPNISPLSEHSASWSNRSEISHDQIHLRDNLTLQHLWYDFHHKYQCASPKLDELLPILVSEIEEGGYYSNIRGRFVELQRKLIRTNCIDCLDRTNVMQVRYESIK